MQSLRACLPGCLSLCLAGCFGQPPTAPSKAADPLPRGVWRPADGEPLLHGEAVVDDAVLFDGDVAEVTVEPTAALPGLRARVSGTRRWLTGRAAQLGGPGISVIRDGVAAARPLTRVTSRPPS